VARTGKKMGTASEEMNALGRYLRSRAAEIGISMAELARQSRKSRQTLHAISSSGGRIPEIDTLAQLALVLRVHPLQLILLVFDDYPLPAAQRRKFRARGDQSILVADVTVAHGEAVLSGSRFTKTWEIQNVGTVPWEGRYLRCMDDEIVVSSLQGEALHITERLKPTTNRIAVPFTTPGGIARLSVDFQAPTLPGTCVSYWKSVFADGSFCFPASVGLTCKVRVISMLPSSTSAKSANAA
jgi:transcriptional regulator with XRE-family HTH domain